MVRKITTLVVAGVLLAAACAHAEFITNGSFDASTARTDWNYTSYGLGDDANAQSPFTNVYANNGNGLALNYWRTTPNWEVMAIQTFANMTTGNVSLSFDVNLAYMTHSNRGFSIGLDNYALDQQETYNYKAIANIGLGANFGVGEDALALAGGNGTTNLATAIQGTWYHIDVAMDFINGTMTPSITPFGGSKSTFGALDMYNTTAGGLGRVSISRYGGGGYLNDTYIDNVSVTAVPEPGSLLALGTGLMGLVGLVSRRRK